MKKIYFGVLFSILFLIFLTSCRPEEEAGFPPSNLENLIKTASDGSKAQLYKLAAGGGDGAWFALAAACEEAGYHNLARSLKAESAEKDGAPFGLISLTSLLIEDPGAMAHPLKSLKKAVRDYGNDERLRHARIRVLAAKGRERDLLKEMDNYRGESWEAPVLAAALRRGNGDAELKAVTERFILHVDKPEVLLLLPQDSIAALSPAYRHLFTARTTHSSGNSSGESLENYKAWLTATAVSQEVCSLESAPPVFAEMADEARQAGLEGEWAEVLMDAASGLCGSKHFGAAFQAGRLYWYIGEYRKASSAFLSAAEAVPRGLPRDRALWFRLKAVSQDNSISLEEELAAFSRAAGGWDKPERFEDVLEEFIHRRVRRGEWNALKTAFGDWGSSWPAEERAVAAWVLAFAEWEGRLTGSNGTADYLKTAYEAAPWSWPGLRAAGLLDKTLPELSSLSGEDNSPVETGENDLIIRLYLKWGLNQLAADTLMQNPNLYTSETLRLTAHALEKDNPRLSIRVASQLWGREGFKPSGEDLLLRYPLPLGNLSEETALAQGLPPEILTGLVRTESAWDSKAVSRSGAEGLSQFMPSTWEEWTRRLRLPEDANPMDPETNLTLAAAYLEWLYQREWTFGWPDVLVSYNAGGGRLRSWHREAPGLGEDLFGMSIPVEEPRSYIRKVLSAATIYGYLYAGKSPRSLHEEWGLEVNK